MSVGMVMIVGIDGRACSVGVVGQHITAAGDPGCLGRPRCSRGRKYAAAPPAGQQDGEHDRHDHHPWRNRNLTEYGAGRAGDVKILRHRVLAILRLTVGLLAVLGRGRATGPATAGSGAAASAVAVGMP